jgi:hypothetical protein
MLEVVVSMTANTAVMEPDSIAEAVVSMRVTTAVVEADSMGTRRRRRVVGTAA